MSRELARFEADYKLVEKVDPTIQSSIPFLQTIVLLKMAYQDANVLAAASGYFDSVRDIIEADQLDIIIPIYALLLTKEASNNNEKVCLHVFKAIIFSSVCNRRCPFSKKSLKLLSQRATTSSMRTYPQRSFITSYRSNPIP